MRVADFTANARLFTPAPPVVNVDARQFPVTIHFSRRTVVQNYAEAAFRKVIQIHQKLPPGGILVFLTGQVEIRALCRKLQERFTSKGISVLETQQNAPIVKCSAQQMDFEPEDVDVPESHRSDIDSNASEPEDTVSNGEISEEEEMLGPHENEGSLHVLPLYSLLPVVEQLRVFQSPPPFSRLCVVATNVAETSLTIPGIKYVVDCGRVKERVYNKDTGVESFEIGWISKASAAQRAGRAGRTEPGHCYRLYSSAVFERDFDQFSEPEILKYPIEGIRPCSLF
jgi:ATP-dependent RNA helicase DHX37/DHR1